MATALTPEEQAKHVTIWNRRERRKIAGNAAPLRRNLSRYLNKHPECEEYVGQDKDPSQQDSDEIDPITGEPISVQNEHVPIWHRVERRKVTGNAAPLRKNLVTYLTKNPNCEVYDGQDKQHTPSSNWHYSVSNLNSSVDAHGLSRSHAHTSPISINAPHRPAPTSEQQQQQLQYHMHLQTHQPVNNALASNNAHKECDWDPPPLSINATDNDPSPCQRSQPMQIPQATHVNDLPWTEMVSSWSNNPEWLSHPTNVHNHSSAQAFGCCNSMPQCYNSQMCGSPMDTTHESDANAIPIPDHSARERDLIIPSSFGPETTNMDYAAPFLCVTPKSIDLDHDAFQFSPSNYLLASSLPKASPPRGSPMLPSCQTLNPFVLGAGKE